jgi:hypothetical protein
MARTLADEAFGLGREPGVGASWKRVRLGADGPNRKEAWLRDHIAANPELVLVPCRAFELIDDEPWQLWAVEVGIAAVGAVDVVLVSASGRVGLVEVKLARNPENRRKVVAQLLDYAIHLRETELEDLPSLPAEGNEPFADPEDVRRRLQEGDYLLLVAADAADERAAKLTRAVLDRNAIHPWDLALVDLALFARPGARDEDELLCVPNIVGGVRCESRHVVQVRVENRADKAAVTVELSEPVAVEQTARGWDLATFREAFDRLATDPAYKRAALALVDDAARIPGLIRGARQSKWPVAVFEQAESLLLTIGRNAIWIYGCDRLVRCFGEELGERRWAEVRALFPAIPDRKPYFAVKADDPQVGAVIEMVRRWFGLVPGGK